MKFLEDPRIKTSRKCLALAWIFHTIYLFILLMLSYTLGTSPYLWGLPRWVAVANIIIPVVFVVSLILIAEKLLPDIPLSDNKEESEKHE